MTETKSATQMATVSGNSSNSTIVKKITTSTPSVVTTSMTTPLAGVQVISAINTPVLESKNTKDENTPPHRRPMPKLIPIVEQQQNRRMPTIIRLQPPESLPADNTQTTTATAVDYDDNYYNVMTGRNALSDFASLIDNQYDPNNIKTSLNTGNTNKITTIIPLTPISTVDRRRSGSSTGSSSSPKTKTASFFDKLKAKVDEMADLTCSVCQYESKCLSEFMCHQRTHDDDEDDIVNDDEASQHIIVVDKSEKSTINPLPVTAAELKSTRCQRCRKRCKISTELMVHLSTCREGTTTTAVNSAIESSAVDEGDDENVQQLQQHQHPMENKIFVWNTSALPTSTDNGEEQGSVTKTETTIPSEKSNIKPPPEEQEDDNEDDDDDDEQHEAKYLSAALQLQQQNDPCSWIQLHGSRKEGKMYKTVFKCPHCTFWAATASRFHVHIVGHLNRKPFECSCCAYRSNWRWDITKHIRLKSTRKSSGEESTMAPNSHHGAKVLMTDETGRRNYSKYNRYLTVMEMDMADGADKAAGGDLEDGKGVAGKRSVGGGITRKRRTTANTKAQNPYSVVGRIATSGGVSVKKFKAGTNRNQKIALKPPSLVASSDNRSKTVWKCKKCFFRDCDRLTVLNHVKAHYRRGEFGNNSGGPNTSSQNLSEHRTPGTSKKLTNDETKKSTDLNNTSDQKPSTTENRKIKAPTTGTVSDSLLHLSTNPKSLMMYDDENFLSCPLCDVTANCSNELKEHMQRTHIPKETKYRCEYCSFWSEAKKAMLDHMMFAHELDDGSVNTDTNATEANYRIEQRDGLNSNSNDIEVYPRENHEEIHEIDETGSNKDMTANMEVFGSSCNDDITTTTNMQMVFENSNDNFVLIETIECKPGSSDNDGTSIQKTPSKSSEKSCCSSTTTKSKINDTMMKCDYRGVKKQEDKECLKNDEIKVIIEEVMESQGENSNKITKDLSTKAVLPVGNNTAAPQEENRVYECNECWYFSTNRKDIHSHKQLHVKRGALYNCTHCEFNVTQASVLYHHYRYGHVIEEPELRFPEETVIQEGYREIIAKNDIESQNRNVDNAVDIEDTSPPIVWSYNKEGIQAFTKVFKCRYCPHTNRRRHNTVEHERMHLDHPEHQNHRQLQQRLTGSTAPPPALHPCKRCTYVCNNAGVLASHAKVHSTSYGYSTKGFYDDTIVDVMQIRALEYVMELEENLVLDKVHSDNNKRTAPNHDRSSNFSIDCDIDNQDDAKFTEIDEPELKFCSYCPARFFFRSDLRCHIRFHKFRNWQHACDCCSFVGRASSHIAEHEIVHRDEYTQRTAELLTSGYPVSRQYPRLSSKYPVSVVNDSLIRSQHQSYSSSQSLKYDVIMERRLISELNSQQEPSTNIRYLNPTKVSITQPALKQLKLENTTKRQRRSSTISIDVKTDITKLSPLKIPVPLQLSCNTADSSKTVISMKAVSKVEKLSTSVTNKFNKGVTIKNTTKSTYIRQYTCDKCPGRFFKSTALQYHYRLHGGPGQYKCRQCDYSVSTYGNLVRHESIHTDLLSRKRVKSDESKLSKSSPKSKPKVTKDKVEAQLLQSLSSAQTLNITNDNKCTSLAVADYEDNPLDPEFGPSMLGNPAFYYPTTIENGVARPKRYKCPKCPSAFDKRKQYAIHLTLHGSKDKYQCDKCDYSVRYTANYVQHQRKHAHDAEIRKNLEQAAERAKIIAAQEEAANQTQRGRKKLNAANQKQKLEDLPPIKLDPRDTTFRNEISDRQTAYELNAAYGDTGVVDDETEENPVLFRCTHCPFECGFRSQIDRHTLHHQEIKGSRRSNSLSSFAEKRTWKLSCRFCSYRTHGDADLTEHTHLHFLRSTSAVLSSFAAKSVNGSRSKDEVIEPADHIEFHGKRVVYPTRRPTENCSVNGDAIDTIDNNYITSEEEEPFFVFRDHGNNYGAGSPAEPGIHGKISKSKRFSPDFQIPLVLVDYNDNRTAGSATDINHQNQQQQAAIIRFIDGGKRLEFLNNGRECDTVKTNGKKKKRKK